MDIIKIDWRFNEKNPVIKPGDLNGKFDKLHAGTPFVMQEGNYYLLYYWGIGEDEKSRICMARCTVDKPNEWEPLGAVLQPQEYTEYNYKGPAFPFIIKMEEKLWYMTKCPSK